MRFRDCTWLNPPARWRLDDESLTVVTDRRTDFWRETHYGFTRDSGHFFGCATDGDFTAQLRIRARYDALYDQAGIMVRVDAETWIKAGIEMSDGRAMLSSVLTIGRSDWATGPYGGDAAEFWIRATVREGVLRLQVSADGLRWSLLRLAPFRRRPSTVLGRCAARPSARDWKRYSPIFGSRRPWRGIYTIRRNGPRTWPLVRRRWKMGR